VLLAALAVYPVAAGHRQVPIVVAIGGASCAVALVGLVLRRWLVLVWAFALFGAEYAVFLRLRTNAVDVRAPLVAAVLLVAAEVAFGAVGPESGRGERSLVTAEIVRLAGAGFGAVLTGGVLLLAAGSASSGVALEAVGALAGVCAVALIAAIARRRV
jgi:hypothetical protein